MKNTVLWDVTSCNLVMYNEIPLHPRK